MAYMKYNIRTKVSIFISVAGKQQIPKQYHVDQIEYNRY